MYKYRIVFLFVFILNIFHCQSLQETLKQYAPDITLEKITLADLDLEGVSADFHYKMRNKIPANIIFSRLAYKIFIDGKLLIEADNKKNIELKSKATSDFIITHRIKYLEFIESLAAIFDKDTINVKLQGVVGVLIPHINESLEVPIEAEQQITLPKRPNVEFIGLKFKSANLNPFKPNATFELNFKLKNPNLFDINLSFLQYSFEAAGSKLIDGKTSALKILSQKEAILNLPINLNGKSIIELVPKLKQSNINYRLNGNMNFNIGGKDINLPYAIP